MRTLTLEAADTRTSGSHGPGIRVQIGEAGGTIGRSVENQLVLDDRGVSRLHARIRYERGQDRLEDCDSTNGVYVNTLDHRLAPGEPYALAPGDRLLVGPFEIAVSFDAASTDDPFESYETIGGGQAPELYAPLPVSASDPDDVRDPLLLIGGPVVGPPPRVRVEPDQGRSVLNDAFEPPPLPAPPRVPAGGIPEDYNPAEDESLIGIVPPSPPPAVPDASVPVPAPMRPAPPDPPAPPPAHAAPPPAASAAGLGTIADVLRGAGLEHVPVTPDLAEDLGRILRIVVSGTIDVLRVRQELKQEFRIRGTVLQPVANNPLKISANFEDALHNLFAKRNAAFLGPVEAFEDVYDDVRHHQVAMLEGVRHAFAAMLAEFGPDRLQEAFDRRMKTGALIAMPAKLRYWDLYRAWFHDMVRDTDASFRDSFGDEFARVYEQHLARAKQAERRAQGR